MSGADQRQARRIKTWFEALHSSGRNEGDGFIIDLSDSGALVEEVTFQPSIRSRVRLLVRLPDRTELELVGQVVRCTESGFGVEFEKHYPILRQLID